MQATIDDFHRDVRRKALREAAARLRETAPPRPAVPAVNVHLHTFHSFNALGWSPSRVVLEGRTAGLEVVGTVDFDVLDALEEVFEAGDLLDARTVAALETRVFMSGYADREINSPGEPGVSYFMGTGFTAAPPEGSPASQVLARLRAGARSRNEAMLRRLAPRLDPVRVEYERDVLPLTPGGNATERHMLAALDEAARKLFPDEERRAEYWARAAGMDAGEARKLLGDSGKLRNTLRARLMKRGGPGYVQPDRSTFPPLEEVVKMVVDAGAIPCATWLDGTSAGEADAGRLLDDYLALGCLAVNVIPDRNWNIADPAERRRKVGKLRELVEAARTRDLVFSVGTEMNAPGQKSVDTFDAPEMVPFAGEFIEGAYVLYGHTVLGRTLGQGLTSAWARESFGGRRREANRFYGEVGRRAFPPREAREKLGCLTAGAGPDEVLEAIA
jgi:hypothetical protein